ncbi:PREDICTED: uncharacterized protein LOC107074550 [Polistes dominula]|uniref:Uncharacterized protein LOC107074550 n=1 Tax=Polistes dominula TaxID=743375 RepID=A0ABM1JGH0_POLDO|nr:PREDICTED: uncharacterized protein LOC107074550 [Polistes dominula]
MDALQTLSATTKTGKQRQRIKWSDEMNRTVMRCCYTATKIETIDLGYRTEMHRLFTTRHPELEPHITEQRIIDQKRTILINNRILASELQIIKEAVVLELSEPAIQDTTNIHPTEQDWQHQNPERKINGETQPITNRNIQQHDTTQETRERQIQENTNQNDTIEIQRALQTNIIIWKNTQHINENTTIQDIHMMLYAAAITTTQQNKQKIPEETPNNQQKTINKHRIHTIRKDIGRLTQAMKDKNNNNYIVNQLLDTLKQKLAVYAARLKRCNESNKSKVKNRTFLNSERTFYRKLNTEQEIGSIQPTKKEISAFWT